MDKALNQTLSSLPDDTKVYVSYMYCVSSPLNWYVQPGHEYTKGNVKFGIQVMQSEPIKKLESFANANKQTQGKFTMGDEKVCGVKPYLQAIGWRFEKQHNVFMRLEVWLWQTSNDETHTNMHLGPNHPEIHW